MKTPNKPASSPSSTPDSDQLKQTISQLQQQLAARDQEYETLRRRSEEYDIIFDSTPIMFWYKDAHNHTLRVNKAAADFERLPPSAIEGHSAYDLYPKEQAEAFYADDLEVIRSGKPKLGIVERHTNPVSGELMWVQTGKVPYRDKNGDIIGVIAFAVDITGQKVIEDKLRDAHNTLERQNRQLNRAHEFLRSTLDHLKMALQRGASKAELSDYLESIQQEFQRLDQR
ncbi:MAG: PAS domain-containing protein [Anaerolineae bacterium]|nr:PAS domain-containing protein [Anaerolineae bacterium]